MLSWLIRTGTVALAAALLLAGCGSSGTRKPSTAGLPPAVARLAARASARPATHAGIGFSDEDPAAFADPYFVLLRRQLRIRYARLIVGYADLNRAASWLAAVRAAGLIPSVALYGEATCINPAGTKPPTGNCPPPSDAAYSSAFAAIINRFPFVHEWGPWNEPSNYRYYPCATSPSAGGGTPPPQGCAEAVLSPAQAAHYYLDAEQVERRMGRADTLIAGDAGADCTPPSRNLCTSDGGLTWTGYVPSYLDALGSVRPPVWGTHSYHDLQMRPSLAASETDLFVRFLNQRAGAPKLWLTEEAAWLGGVDGGALDGNAAAQAAAARQFLDLPLVPSAKPGQISREYYYLLRAKPTATFDSALLDLNGLPRASYCVLVGAAPQACEGNPSATPIAAPYAQQQQHAAQGH